MADEARVGSIGALEDFRTSLLRYRERTTNALDEVGAEVKRTREWLSHDCRIRWQGEVKRRTRKLEQAEAELMTSRFSDLKDDQSVQQQAVRKAKVRLEEAEEKLRVSKRWARDFDSVVAPAVKQLESLRDRVDGDFPKAVATMGELIGSLRDYAESRGAPRQVRGEGEEAGS